MAKMVKRHVKFGKDEVVRRGWLMIFSGPARSGKSSESRKLRDDPNEHPFEVVEGNGDPISVQIMLTYLDRGIDVIYETTLGVSHLPKILLDNARTIEIFRRDDE